MTAYGSWAAADLLDEDHPFRGFLIACAVLFVPCVMGYYGVYSDTSDADPEGQGTMWYVDEAAAKRAAETGRFYGQFLVYVAASYAGMLAKLAYERHCEREWDRSHNSSTTPPEQ